MATISISNLRATGADLFADSESYLSELTDAELNETKGGSIIAAAAVYAAVVIATAIAERMSR
jgi:hypothetical protein